MRIFFFARRYPVPYKPYYDAQFADLVARGHEITIFAGGTHDQIRNEKVVRHQLAERTRYFPATRGAIVRRIPGIARGLWAPPISGLSQALSAAARGDRRQSWIHAARMLSVRRDRPDLLFIHGLGTAVMLPWLRNLYPGTPLAMYYHGGEVPTSNELRSREPAAAFREMDVIFTNTEFSRQHAIERGAAAEKVEILPVGFDIADFTPPAQRTYRSGGTLRLLSAGRMSEEKGIIYALGALKQLIDQGIQDIHYSLTGAGYLRESLEAYVRANGLERFVTFLGALTTEGVIHAMGAADVLLLPSIQVGNWVENQACAVQEALLMKAIVVTSRTGGVPESIPAEMQPFVVPPGDVESLAHAIRTVHEMPMTEMARLGSAGRAFVMANYDVRGLNDRMIARTLAAHRGNRFQDAPGAARAAEASEVSQTA